jgi:hypothetical protein
VFRATRGAQPGGINETLLVWNGVPVIPPGTNSTRIFRFTNIRVNATTIGTSALIPTQVIAFVSVNPPGTLPIDNPQQIVGYVQQGMLFDVRSCSGGDDPNPQLAQCSSLESGLFNNPQATDTLTGQGALRYREGFQTAFKTRILPGQDASVPGVVYNSESGFVRLSEPVLNSGSEGVVGLANTGTRLAARFVNVPAGIRIFVGTRQSAGSTGGATAVLVSTDPNGSSGAFNIGGITAGSLVPPTAPVSNVTMDCGGVETPNLTALEVPLTSGSGLAVWEVTAANTNAQDTLLFAFGVAYVTNQLSGIPGVGTAQVIGNLAPFYSSDAAQNPGGANANNMSQILPIPRFAARTDATRLFRTVACQTNLLFPYVTSAAGWDTGIAISNTSADPFDSARRQQGTCTINYYGTLANGNALPTASETTDRDVVPGTTMAFVLSTGGTFGLKGNSGMTGYIIATCRFQFAHGFAFISDGPIGQARVAEGYVALIMDTGTVRRGTTGGEALDQ